MKKKIYCVGNAHLDPVWMWRWQEGSCEAKATIRSALDRMKEYPDFKFCCAGAQIFEWIETFDPQMFEEIRQRVEEGRFVIVGGWYIQPDCNLPSGESFVRHGLYSQRYFMEKFGVTARVGYNVDSFGHNAMIPQFLRKQGMDSYIFMRPGGHEKELPSHIFRWQAPDGSEVLTGKILVRYNYAAQMMDIPGLEESIAAGEALADPGMDQMFLFYGVGNHGGGPTKKNIEAILGLQEKGGKYEPIFSDASDFFDRAKEFYEKIPVVRDDLQHHASGCYGAVSAVKREIRRAECDLYEAEIFGMLAQGLAGYNGADPEKIRQAWKSVLFSHFHDSMGGCSVRSVHEDTLLQLGESRTAAQRMTNNALQTLSWKVHTADSPVGNPCVIFNPHPFPVRQMVRLNAPHRYICGEDGRPIPSQLVQGQNDMCRKEPGDTVFMAEVPAMGYTTYYRAVNAPEGAQMPIVPNAPRAEGEVLENGVLRVTFDAKTGHIASITDLEENRELLGGFGAVPVVIDEADHDTWSHGKNFFDREIGAFTDAKIQVLETGPVRAMVKVTSRWGDSTLSQYFSLLPGAKQLDVRCRLDWHESRKMLKLRYQTALEDPRAYYEIPYGVMERPADGEEEPGLMWVAARDSQNGLAMINDSKYSFSIRGGRMDLTAIRSPYYNDHGRGVVPNAEHDLTDQGVSEFSYAVMPLEEGWSGVIRAAKALNMPCTVIQENRHKGVLDKLYSGICCDASNVLLCALKPSEDGKGTVLRAYETDGRKTHANISGDLLPVPLQAEFTPYSIRTYYLPQGGDAWKEILMTELDA